MTSVPRNLAKGQTTGEIRKKIAYKGKEATIEKEVTKTERKRTSKKRERERKRERMGILLYLSFLNCYTSGNRLV